MEKINTNIINRVLVFSLLVFSISIVFVVSKYIGIVSLLVKIIKSLIPVFIAVFISFILEPLIVFFSNKGIKRKYSVLLAYGLIAIFFILFFVLTIPSLIDQTKILVGNIPNLIETASSLFAKIGFSFNQTEISNFIDGVLIKISKEIVFVISSSFSIAFNIILGVSGALFLSFDFDKFRNGFKNILPKRIKGPVIYYFHNFLPFVHKYFKGILIDSIFIFIISFIGFYFINIEYILVLSLFVAITNLIPIIGPYIGGIPALIVGFSVSSTLGISALIVVVIVQLIESNIVQPLILKNSIKLHPLEGILGISLFGSLFGVVGMILSPILVVSFKLLLFLPYYEKEEKKIIDWGTFLF